VDQKPLARERLNKAPRLLVFGFAERRVSHLLAIESINVLGDLRVVVFQKRRIQHTPILASNSIGINSKAPALNPGEVELSRCPR